MARSSYPATIQLWQSRYEQFQNSKLSVEQFCDSIGCCKSALYYWRRIFAGSSQESATPQASVEGKRTRSFVPVLVRTTESQSVVILLSDGTKIELQCDPISALNCVLQDAKKAS